MKTILLVEDDKFLNDLYADTLRRADYKVIRVADAQEALDELDKSIVDLLILDIFLPINNAFEIIQQLQSYKDWQSLPIILISSQQLSGQELTGKLKRQLSIVDFLYKPDTLPSELVNVVKSNI